MTGATMVQFTPDAEHRLGEYLRQVRSAAARSPGVSPDDIEADIREHIAAEFHAAVRPVGLAELEAVLVRLGPPAQWVSANSTARPAEVLAGQARSFREWVRQTWRALLAVLWRGPEDWRLPYLAFGSVSVTVAPTDPTLTTSESARSSFAGAQSARRTEDDGAERSPLAAAANTRYSTCPQPATVSW